MRIATRVCVWLLWPSRRSIFSASAAEVLRPVTPAPLSLDIGAEGAPDAVQAFAAMRRAAELGHT